MKIAFVGKGGSGKSTIAALFFRYIVEQSKTALCVDADLNIHIPQLLGVSHDEEKSISLADNAKRIKEYLRGDSALIESSEHMYKTTPPSTGVKLLTLVANDPIIQGYTTPFLTGHIMTVGTYEASEIGKSCYHTNLSILENILSFTHLYEDEWLVADMVAGIDAFSNTLHAQFDILCLVIEPTAESLSVYQQYYSLAGAAGVLDRLRVIGNKITDASDKAYITQHVDSSQLVGIIQQSDILKTKRRELQPLELSYLQTTDTKVLRAVAEEVIKHRIHPNQRLKTLHILHRKYIDQDYVKNAVGDLQGQIDLTFHYPA